MSKIRGLFSKRWVLQLPGLLAASVIVWFVGPLIAIAGTIPLESVTARLVTVLLLLITWLFYLFLAHRKAQKADQDMAQALGEAHNPQTELPQGESQSQEELQQLSQRFDQALSVLKKTSQKSLLSGSQYLYELPWYLVIGPPGSGKTTALINSGLHFPLSDTFGKDAIRGVGGTRNCDWWFTDDAILIDTAGRYTTQDSHQASDSGAWLGFLQLLKKHRQQRPINGILITVSVTDLLLFNQQELEQHSKAIKNRIEELYSELGVRAPIYMLLSKCDLIAGFNEFFCDLTHEQRDQVWGFTLPLSEETAQPDPTAQIPQYYADLLERLNSHMLSHIHKEKEPARRAALFSFPQEMAALKAPISKFAELVFQGSRYQQAPLLRGLYFTSGTQEGTPIDRLMGNLAASFGLDRTSQASFSGKGKSYFIHDLFAKLIFNESGIVGSNKKAENRRAWLQKGAYLAALALMVFCTGLWLTSYSNNQQGIKNIEEFITQYEKELTETPYRTTEIEALLPTLDALRAASDVYQDEVPTVMAAGLYQGDKLDPAVHQTYQRELNGRFLYSLGAQLETLLQDTQDTTLLWESLKTYLMLGRTQYLEPEQVKLFMSLVWSTSLTGKSQQQASLKAHLDTLLSQRFSPLPLNEHIVTQVREVLRKQSIAEYIYSQIKQESALNRDNDFLLSKVLGRHGERVFTFSGGTLMDARIPVLYTYDGYHQLFVPANERLTIANLQQNWVLDDQPHSDKPDSKQIAATKAKIEEFYIEDYISHWSRLLNQLNIVTISDLTQAVNALEAASSPSSPVRKLLMAVGKETSLSVVPKEQSAKDVAQGLGEAASVLSTAADSQKTRLEQLMRASGKVRSEEEPLSSLYRVDSHFKQLNALVQTQDGNPPPIDDLINDLYEVYSYLSELQASGSALDAAKRTASGGNVNPLKQLQQKAKLLPKPVQGWVMALTNQGWSMVVGGTRHELSGMLGQQILPLCQRGIQGRFPFSARLKPEVTLLDFTRFFAPGQLVDSFFTEHIQPFADTRRSPWRWKTANGHPMGISNQVLRQFEQIGKIRSTFFSAGGKSAQIGFSVKPVYLDTASRRVVLDINGQTVTYQHGPAILHTLRWPSPNDTTGQSSIRFDSTDGKSYTLAEEGVWAWFKLLTHAELKQQGQADRFRIAFELQGHRLELELRADSVDNPYLMNLEAFRCPRL